MDFWQLIDLLSKRKWLILLSVVSAVALTYGATRLIGSRWVATVTFVSPENTPAVDTVVSSSDDETQPVDTGAKQVAVYAAMIKSPTVIQPVVSQLGPNAPTTRTVLENTDFESTDSHLYQLQITAMNPIIAQQLANGIANRFVDLDKSIRAKQAS